MEKSRVGDVELQLGGAVARAIIDRPGSKNALAPSVLDGIRAAVGAAVQAGCTVFVLRGAGGTLSAGADLRHLEDVRHDEAGLTAYIAEIGAVLDLLESAPIITVAVVEEYALAGGCEVLLACDLAVVSEDAHIGDRHLEYGLLPGAGGSVRLPRVVPAALARRLLLTAEMIDGATAASWGLISHVAPAGELDATVGRLVARLTRHSGPALLRMKDLYRGGRGVPVEEALVAERTTLVEHLISSADAAEGLAAFAERRPPRFGAAGPATVS